MERVTIFMIRAVLSFACGTLLMRLFYPDQGFVFAVGLGLLLLALAYFSAYWRHRKSK
ncbi:hypothetical protein DSLASN_27450 [Desulfoluna limicola]|uniref:Uncharacterized protein n=1 Tax=Desulfoluna limicola TaxID=2810562 RepID=A0ABM7PJ56_9BACT|nr:hypothetical protein [Desulfoluna limicola]BCS97113.1 hypothetical protein DSLASN_27450 [Desulfoluna limicola]